MLKRDRVMNSIDVGIEGSKCNTRGDAGSDGVGLREGGHGGEREREDGVERRRDGGDLLHCQNLDCGVDASGPATLQRPQDGSAWGVFGG